MEKDNGFWKPKDKKDDPGEELVREGSEGKHEFSKRWENYWYAHVQNTLYILMGKIELMNRGQETKPIGPLQTFRDKLEQLKKGGYRKEEIEEFERIGEEGQDQKTYNAIVNEFNSRISEIGKDPKELKKYAERFALLLRKDASFDKPRDIKDESTG